MKCNNLEVKTGERKQKMCFLVTDLGDNDLILGYPWLLTFEPKFSWHDGVIDTHFLPIIICSLDWKQQQQPTVAWLISGQWQEIHHTSPQRLANRIKQAIVDKLEEEYIQAWGISTMLAQGAQQYTQHVEIPDEYWQHAWVFSKEESHCFPPAHLWDHAIHFKPGSPDSLNCKIYPMTPVEKMALWEWIDDMERKKYIEKAKPDQAYLISPFFFLKKKDGKQWPVQDYCCSVTTCTNFLFFSFLFFYLSRVLLQLVIWLMHFYFRTWLTMSLYLDRWLTTPSTLLTQY